MVVFRNGTHVDLCLRNGQGMTSDLREIDPELETIRAFKLACVRICSCINEGYSWGFPGFYWQNGFQNIWDRVQKFWKFSACEMTEFEVPSMSQSLIGGMPYAGRC